MDITPPKAKKQVQALLGLIIDYSKLISRFAEKTAALSPLIKKGRGWKIGRKVFKTSLTTLKAHSRQQRF